LLGICGWFELVSWSGAPSHLIRTRERSGATLEGPGAQPEAGQVQVGDEVRQGAQGHPADYGLGELHTRVLEHREAELHPGLVATVCGGDHHDTGVILHSPGSPGLGAEVVLCGLGGDDRLAPGGGPVPPQAAVVPVGEECWPGDLPVVNHLVLAGLHLVLAGLHLVLPGLHLVLTGLHQAALHCTVLESQDSL